MAAGAADEACAMCHLYRTFRESLGGGREDKVDVPHMDYTFTGLCTMHTNSLPYLHLPKNPLIPPIAPIHAHSYTHNAHPYAPHTPHMPTQ